MDNQENRKLNDEQHGSDQILEVRTAAHER